MKNKYDFSKAIKNPYAKKLKKPISIRIDEDVIAYFKKIADEVGVSYQVLMNLYLRQVKNEELTPRFVQEAKLARRSLFYGQFGLIQLNGRCPLFFWMRFAIGFGGSEDPPCVFYAVRTFGCG